MPIKKKKDWYWEAEQDKIAADESLKLIRCDPGESEGLECVGLWFLMMNLMARSVRKGYLLSPADDRNPMSSHELAVLTGRAEAVVTRIQVVILQRGLFSKNEGGIIFSRGMIRKEELRKIRSKAGRKSALCKKVLLKQKRQQNDQQTLGIGIGIESDSIPLNGSAKIIEEKEGLFLLFWSVFPSGRKQGKGAARKAWIAACKKTDHETILGAAIDYAKSPVGNSEFVKAPASWLNQECWADDRQAWYRSSGGAAKPNLADAAQSAHEWAFGEQKP